MDDAQIEARIDELEREQRALRADEGVRAGHADDPALAADAKRIEEIRVELDQQWDLLRRRRARRSAGEDPDGAQVRDESIVENYLN